MQATMRGHIIYLNDRSLTSGTLGREEGMVVSLTVRQAIFLTEGVQIQRLVTLHTGETLRMPGLSKSGNNFLQFERENNEIMSNRQMAKHTSVIGFLQAKHFGRNISLK